MTNVFLYSYVGGHCFEGGGFLPWIAYIELTCKLCECMHVMCASVRHGRVLIQSIYSNVVFML